MQLKRLLGAWGFALSFRRECLSFLDVSFVGAQSLPSCKPCQPSGLLLDELVLVSVLAQLFSANQGAPPLSELFAFDASDARAGECRAPVSEDQWRSLYDLSEEREEHVRLDWGSQLPEPVFSDTRAAAAWSACLSRESPSFRLRSMLTSASIYLKPRALYRSCGISPRKDNAIAEYLR